MPQSKTRARITISDPQEAEIRIRPFQSALGHTDPDNRLNYWYLELAEAADLVIGRRRSQLQSDLAAMRALAAAAAEAAGLLERAIAQLPEGGPR